MKLFKTVLWNEHKGTYKHYVIENDKEELNMMKMLQEKINNNIIERYDLSEINIDEVDNIMELRGLSLSDLKRLIS